jgi:hypothetical protein
VYSISNLFFKSFKYYNNKILYVTYLGKIWQAHNITNYFFMDYGSSLLQTTQNYTGGSTTQDILKTMQDIFIPLGFRADPWQAEPPLSGTSIIGQDVIDQRIPEIQAAQQVQGGYAVGAPIWGWGYDPIGWGYDLSQQYPYYTDYMYTVISGTPELQVASSCPSCGPTYPSIAADNVTLILGAFQTAYSNLNSYVGNQNLPFVSGWVLADHGYSVDNIVGNPAGHNINSYIRFTATTWYTSSVNSSGNHIVDNSPCLLWSLKGMSVPQTTNYIPSIQQAQDVNKYHKGTTSNPQGYDYYMGLSVLQIEYGILQILLQANNNLAFDRTAFPMLFLKQFAPFIQNPELFYVVNNGNIMQDGFNAVSSVPWLNLNNPQDNSSNPGGGYGGATNATVLNYMLNIVPYYSNNQLLLEVDTAPQNMNFSSIQANTPAFIHFGNLVSKMSYVGGWYGYETNSIPLLHIDHYYTIPQNFTGLGIVASRVGIDSYTPIPFSSLSQFKVIFGLPNSNDPNYANDIALIEKYVQNGGNLVVYYDPQAGWSSNLNALFGCGYGGTTKASLVISQPSHPILQPYASSDLIAGLTGGARYSTIAVTNVASTVQPIVSDTNNSLYLWVNNYGSGKVVVLPLQYYGDGFSTGNQNYSDALSSGKAYLTLNAILWASGNKTPAIYLPKYVQRTAWATPLNSNGEGGYSGVGIHICGIPNGKKLVWISNNNTSSVQIQFNLSSNFFNILNSGSVVDLNTGQTISTGSGDIQLSFNAPAQDWTLLYFLPSQTTTNLVLVPSPTSDNPQYELISGISYTSTSPHPVAVSGNNMAIQRFMVNQNLTGFKVAWRGYVVATSGSNLTVTLYPDNGNQSPNFSSPIEAQTVVASSVSTTDGWQPFITFNSSLQANTLYWLVFTTDSNGSYIVDINWAPQDMSGIAAPSNSTSQPAYDNNQGTILWIQDMASNDVSIYPALFFPATNLLQQSFVATSNFAFDTVWLFQSDRAYDPLPVVLNVSVNGNNVASTQFSPLGNSFRGMGTDSWLPIYLGKQISVSQGQTVSLSVSTLSSTSIYWTTFKLQANPTKAGFQGQSSYYTFALTLSGAPIEQYFSTQNIHQSDEINATQFMAAQFVSTTSSNLESIDVRIWSGTGTLQATLYNDNNNQPGTPISGASTQVSVNGEGWVTATFSTPIPLNQGTKYWIVFSAPNGTILLTRCVNPWVFYVLEYFPSLSKWSIPAQGPTDLAIRIVTSTNEYRLMIDQINHLYVSPTKAVAQSFTAHANETATGAVVELFTGMSSSGGGIYTKARVSLYSDNNGQPGTELAYGDIGESFINVDSLFYAAFNTAVTLTQGTRYWLVIRGETSVVGVTYVAMRPGFEADDYNGGTEPALVGFGNSWSPILTNTVANLHFQILSGTAPSTTLIPTNLSITLVKN